MTEESFRAALVAYLAANDVPDAKRVAEVVATFVTEWDAGREAGAP
jgi:hypothetical protein